VAQWTSRSLGHCAPGDGGAEITTAQDLATVVNGSLSTGLRQLRFQPTDQPAPNTPELRVEIRSLDYKVSQGFWSGGLVVDVAMKGICIIGNTRPYEQIYRGSHQENIQVVQSQSQNEEYINSALTRALEALLGDARLTSCLAGA
jgi:hypothetical protein